MKAVRDLKKNRLIEVEPKDNTLGYATAKAHYASIRDISKDEVISKPNARAKVWKVEAERVVYAGDEVEIGEAGKVKVCTKEGTPIGVALTKAVKGEVASIRRM